MAGGVRGAPKMAGAEDGGSEAAGTDTRPLHGPRTGLARLPCPLAGAECVQHRLPEARVWQRQTAMQLPGGTASARFFLALCVWRLMPRRDAAGTEEVVFGKLGGSVLLLCRNVSREAAEVVWFQGDPHSFPPLFSSRVTFPPDVRFSLVDNSSLHITELRLQDEGNYTCKEVLNRTDHEHRVQLLVANPPQSTPKCWAETSSSGLTLQLFCSWPGGYPHPTLHWREEGHDLENSSWVISSTSSSDTHVETLNSSHLSHRKVFKCVGSHVIKQEEPSCTVEIKIPSLETDPPKTCFVGDNVTLTCRVAESTPPARLSWLRDITQPEVEIQPGGRYLITQEGNMSQLTIQNCSQGTDGGCYICKAQNPVGLRELFVCLTVKQPVNIVGVVGAVVVLSLLAVLTITGVILYYNPLLCLRGAAFRNQDSGDVLVLVDSEDDNEGKGEEETLSSSTKQEAMTLVNGNRVQAAYLNCLTEGDDGEQHSRVSLQETRAEEMQGS
ncbi:LOW QUALITY PROTEIN: V-set and immunoglobulin domain-containing protein 10 [Heliangelus exortis]|uniref:LOW QUALITY PROTEIN: V-set and immunoglobulin domain-containing protein 10 n=1 Tax=Heliangelus exortis TaxID=472823 RepID=UPI003A939FE0